MPYKENLRFFPARETGNLKINTAEADLSSTTFTSSSASDSDISLRMPLRMKTKIYTLKLPLIIIIRPGKQCKALSLQEFSSAISKPINWIKMSSRRTDQTTENNLQVMAACLFSRKRRSKGHEQELREELLQSPRIGIENYPSRKAFATHSSDSHSSMIYFFRLN